MGQRDERSGRAGYSLFETSIGFCGVAWSESGLTRLQLPESDPDATERRLRGSAAAPQCDEPPRRIARVIADVQRYLGGANVNFASVPLDLTSAAPFHRKVYDAARSVGWGQTVSYGDLARLAGSPAAARAVGQALARNPVAIIIPCHRILASGGKLGGFSAFRGRTAKECLLALEGVVAGVSGASPRSAAFDAWDADEAIRVLSAADPVLARAIKRTGPFALESRPGGTPFDRLAEAVVHQQLTTKVAGTIFRRLKAALDDDWTPEAVQRADHAVLRGAGLSEAKASTLRALAEKTLDGTIPGIRVIRKMSDDEVVERLTVVKGVGLWTAQMFLIFSLRRPDIMPAHDYGVRRGYQVVFGTPEVPAPAEIQARAERWRPYRTVASWYLWRAADQPKAD